MKQDILAPCNEQRENKEKLLRNVKADKYLPLIISRNSQRSGREAVEKGKK